MMDKCPVSKQDVGVAVHYRYTSYRTFALDPSKWRWDIKASGDYYCNYSLFRPFKYPHSHSDKAPSQ